MGQVEQRRFVKLPITVFAIPCRSLAHAQNTPVADVGWDRLSSKCFGATHLEQWRQRIGRGQRQSLARLAGDFGVYHGHPAESLTGRTYTLSLLSNSIGKAHSL